MPFDLDQLEVTGPVVSVVDGVTSDLRSGGAQMAVSTDGTLAYLPGQSVGDSAPVHWMDLAGNTAPLWTPPGIWYNIHVAPDGRRLSLDVFSGPTSDIWIYEWDRDTALRSRAIQPMTERPVWTPDGRRIAFNSNRDNPPPSLYWQRTDGTGSAERLTVAKHPQWPVSWHPSGKFLAFEQDTAETSWDLMILPVTEMTQPAGRPERLSCSSTVRSPRRSQISRRMGSGSRISRTRPGEMKYTFGRFAVTARDGGSRPAAAPFHLVAHAT